MGECPVCRGFGTYAVPSSVKCADGAGLYAECVDCGGTGLYIPNQLEMVPYNGQSRRKSLVEVITGTAIGFVVSLILTAIVMPAFGYPTTWAHDFWITSIFTVASIVRGYCVRRMFEVWR